MPGPFGHIYTARRVADFLRSSDVKSNFTRENDDIFNDDRQQLLPEIVKELGKQKCINAMDAWPKFTALGAIGPDLFFWLMDFHDPKIPGDDIMLAFSLLYYLDDKGFFDDSWEAMLTILSEELPNGWANILRVVLRLYKIWKKFIKIWNETIGPIVDKAGEVIDDLMGKMLSSLGDALSQLANDVVALTAEEALSGVDLFNFFSLKMREGYDEQAFLWSDMAHYRRTSAIPERFVCHARQMLKSESSLEQEHGQQLLAFAMGWICHVGTDTIAHSFANEQCGGPFRTHWQRHHLLENMIDGWMYEGTKKGGILPADDFIGWKDTYDSLAESALYFAVQIPQDIDLLKPEEKQGDLRQTLPKDDDNASQDKRDELLDTDGALPPWLAETIVNVLIEVFADPNEGGDEDVQGRLKDGTLSHPRNLGGQAFHDSLKNTTQRIERWLQVLGIDNPMISLEELRKVIAPDPVNIKNVPEGFPMPWQMMATYRFMLSWLKRSYVSSFAIDKPPPPEIFTVPASDLGLQPPDFSGVDPNDDPVSQTCETVAALLDWLFKTLKKAAQLCYDLAKMAASAATMPARAAIYYGLTLPMWEAAENMRMVLVHLGYLMPQSEKRDGDGNLVRPNEIDPVLITLGHTVDNAFKKALEDAMDPFGNLDKDEDLIDDPPRRVLGDPNPWLPVRKARAPTVVEFQRPWAFPSQNNEKDPRSNGNHVETPRTIAGPYPVNTRPDRLLRTDTEASNANRLQYQDAQCPAATDALNNTFAIKGFNSLGDPIVFSAYLIGQIAHNPNFISSFNLDADRGFGYLCWDYVRDERRMAPDERNHVFKQPVTWPEGSADVLGRWQKPEPVPVGSGVQNDYGTPLEIHYPGRVCEEGPQV
ncbi:hypothetical protein FMUND_13675 [Fusarium mundagurra]|uniref:Phospholipase C/D domain-containing protein n=1 Tax=Fusarium mundagurra TaxID=1567541 RepID=A0A8H5XYI5_9HYPO|nr:hypothetical protein FMUND_13675 [Fusarium mundagurra]